MLTYQKDDQNGEEMEKQLDFEHEVTVQEMLGARDHRVEMQRSLINEFQHPVLCFMLNIPGPHKVGEDFERAFIHGVRSIEEVLRKHGMKKDAEKEEAFVTGYVYYASIDAPAIEIKKAMCEIEERDRIGRIFDIDVLRTDGTKVSREEFGMGPRKCLMCEKEAHICARNRTHTVSSMVEEIHRIIGETLR